MKYNYVFTWFSVLLFNCMGANVFSQSIELVEFTTGLNQPVDIATAGGDELYVVERPGIIKIVNSDGSVPTVPFMDITDRVLANTGERGLLGLVFHPNYPDSAYIYCNYTGSGGETRISRFNVLSDAKADSTSEIILLNFSQPFTNHNGGDVCFDENGYLMIASGDGGSGGDPQNNAQNLNSLLGKILRLDVDAGLPYGIPASNPFIGMSGVREEIWAYGLRNPWRIDYDDMTNALYVGDVGQNMYEEISKLNTGVSDPNYGWRCYEANHEYNLDSCEGLTFIPPIHEYQHRLGAGCTGSVTGGVVYRGTDIPAIAGRYIFADYCTGFIATLDLDNGNQCDTLVEPSVLRFTTFGEDAQRRLYVATSLGIVYRIQAPANNHFIFTIDLDGSQASTPSTATGYGIATFDSTSNQLNVSGYFNDLIGTPTASHVHQAPAGSNGGVIFDLTRMDYGSDSIGFYGSGTLTPAQSTELLANDGFYVNIHSSIYGGGEIRGQITRVDCPLNYDAIAPLLPPGRYKVKESSVMGSLESNREMVIKFEDSTLLLNGFEVSIGSTLEILQEICGP